MGILTFTVLMEAFFIILLINVCNSYKKELINCEKKDYVNTKRILIVAPNYQQGKYYERVVCELFHTSPARIRIIINPESVRGLRNHYYILVGTWYENKHLNKTLEILSLSNCKQIKVGE